MRILRASPLVVLLIFAGDVGHAAQEAPWLEKLQEWLTAVGRHEPGTEDASARAISSWSRSEFETVVPYVIALAEMLSHPGDRSVRDPRRVFSRSDLRQLAYLAEAEGKGGDHNRVMKRGALLHADIAMLLQPRDSSPPAIDPVERRLPPGRRTSVPQRTVVLSNDGRFEGLETSALHWELGRALLDRVMPNPARDDMVRLWYRGTAAFMVGRRNHADAEFHLQRALQLFPTDADFLFYSGCLREALAAPEVQSVVQTTVLPRGLRIEVASARANLEQAEKYFHRALELNPDFAEARLRLGRVVALRGRHDDAVNVLQRALSSTREVLLRYYGNLFLADAERALGRHDAARESYQRASALYPRAQSPYLGLSQLARSRGDRPGAHRAIERVLALPADEDYRDDPWWDYHIVQGRNADALLAELYKPFLEEVRQ